MPPAAPRIDQRLLGAIATLDRPRQPIAETNRRAGEVAAALGLVKPSYEQVRQIVHRSREGRRVYGALDALVDISFRTASPEVVLNRLFDETRPPRRK